MGIYRAANKLILMHDCSQPFVMAFDGLHFVLSFPIQQVRFVESNVSSEHGIPDSSGIHNMSFFFICPKNKWTGVNFWVPMHRAMNSLLCAFTSTVPLPSLNLHHICCTARGKSPVSKSGSKQSNVITPPPQPKTNADRIASREAYFDVMESGQPPTEAPECCSCLNKCIIEWTDSDSHQRSLPCATVGLLRSTCGLQNCVKLICV